MPFNKMILSLFFLQRVMVDEADVNEAMAGPPSRKRPPIDNRPGSPRDRKRQQETPPVRWPNKTNGGTPLPLNNKVPPDKNSLSQDTKTNNVFPGHGMKRKHSEGSEGTNKSFKASKGLMKPQLAKLQQKLHNKGKLNRKQQPGVKSDASNSSRNDFVSSILKEAVTSQSRTFSGQGVPVVNSNDISVSKNKLSNLEAPDLLVDGVVKERSKGPSPRLLRKQLAREACEENRLIRNTVFREMRQPEKSKSFVMIKYCVTCKLLRFFLGFCRLCLYYGNCDLISVALRCALKYLENQFVGWNNATGDSKAVMSVQEC